MSEKKTKGQGGVIFLTVFLDLVGFSIIFPLFPEMLDYYFGNEGNELLSSLAGGEGEEGYARAKVLFGGLLGSLYSILQFICAPLWGSYSDRVGRKPVLMVTVSGLALSYLLWFFSGSFAILLMARFLGGAMSGNIAVASAAIADTTDAKNRTKGMAIIGIAFGLGFVCGPAIGAGLSHESLNLEKLIGGFGVNPFSAPAAMAFLLSCLNLFWIHKRFQETHPEEKRGQSTISRPINPFKLFRRYEFAGVNRANTVYFLFILLFAGMEFTLVFLAKDYFGYNSFQMGGIFLYIGFIILLVQGGLVRRLAPKLGEKKLAIGGLFALPFGFLLAGFSGDPESLGMFYGGLALLAVGSASITPSMSGLVSRYTPAGRQGEIQGVFRSIGALGRAVGPLLACSAYWEFGPVALYAT
ncbi:MAG: MFS transporter, partial [Planctomycetota bacterium]